MRAMVLGVLVVLLLGGGTLPAAMAAKKKAADQPKPAQDTLLTIPRVGRAPELGKLLDAMKAAPVATTSEAKSEPSKDAPAKEKQTSSKGESVASAGSDSLASRVDALEKLLLSIESRMTGAAPGSDAPGVVPAVAPELGDLESRVRSIERRIAAADSHAPPAGTAVVSASSAGSSDPAKRTLEGAAAAAAAGAGSKAAAARQGSPSQSGKNTPPNPPPAVTPGAPTAIDSAAVDSVLGGAFLHPPAPILSAGAPATDSPSPFKDPGPLPWGTPLYWMAAGAALLLAWIVIARAFRARRAGRDEGAADPDAAGQRNGKGPGRHSTGTAPDARSERSRLRRMFFANLSKVKGSLFLAAFFTLGGASIELLKPWPLKVILDHVILAKKVPHKLSFLEGLAAQPIQLLWVCAGSMLAIAMIGGLFSYLEVFITKAIGIRMVYTLRREVFSHLQRLSLSFHNRAQSGDLLTTFAKDTSTLKDVFAEALLKFADQIFSVIGMLVIMWMVNWRVALIALASVPFLGFTLMHLYRQTKLSLKRQRKQEGKVTSRLNEVLAAVPLVQAFSRERHEEERYDAVSSETLRESIRMTRLEAAASRSSQITAAVGTTAAVLFGGMEVLNGRMLPGELVLVMSYVTSLYKPIRQMAKLSIDLSKAAASAERIADVLEVEPEIQDRPDAVEADSIRGHILFAAVSFDYEDGKEVLRHVSFEVAPGERVALVGISGAGKSTIASLILRLYEAQQGAILIDGLDIDRYRRESLRRQIGIVLQQSVLFGATIRENIAYGKPDATNEEIVAAAKAAHADEFIRELEDGYDAVIGERGVTLSAGQRQRVAIARAVIRNPRILILDEPMTGLDAESEAKVRQALDRLMVGKTTIHITHDLLSIADADQVLVIEDGRIVERGSHAELRMKSGRYRELFDLRAHAAAAPVLEA